MRKKASVILILILIVPLLLIACAQEGLPSATDAEGKQVKGTVAGGDASLGDAVNLKDINVDQQGRCISSMAHVLQEWMNRKYPLFRNIAYRCFLRRIGCRWIFP